MTTLLWGMLIGSFIMLSGITLGWAMANAQMKNQKLDIHVHNKTKDKDLYM